MENDEKLYEYNPIKPDLSEIYLESKGIDYENTLMHFGRLGQKKGVRNGPPYPLDRKKASAKYGKLMPSNKDEAPSQKKGGISGLVEKHKAKKAYKKKVEAANRARQAKAAKAEESRKAQEEQDRKEKEAIEREEWRQNVIRTGDINSAKDNTDKFSTDEINQIINRYQANQKLSNLVDDANKALQPPANTPEPQMSKWEKMGNKIDEINKFAGPLSKLASNASTMYDLASKISKDKQAKDNEQYKRQKEAEEIAYKRKKEAEETKYRREQDALDRKERYDLHMTKEEQNKAKQQQNNQQNQPKQNNQQNNQPKQEKKQDKKQDQKQQQQNDQPRKLTDNDKKAITLLNNKALDAEAMGKDKQVQTYNKEIAAIAKGEKSPSPYLKEASKPYKIDFNTEGWSKKTTIRTEKAAQNVKKSASNAKESAKKSIVNIASNPNTQGALAQLTRDLTKNTKNTSGQTIRIHNNADWLANQSTEVLKLMKKNIDRGQNNPSAMVTLKDINSILKKRGARSPLQ